MVSRAVEHRVGPAECLADEAAGLTALHEELLEVLEVGHDDERVAEDVLWAVLSDCTNMK